MVGGCVGWEVGIHTDEEMSPGPPLSWDMSYLRWGWRRKGYGMIIWAGNVVVVSLVDTALGILSSQNGDSLDGCSCPTAVGNESPQP